MGSSRRRGHRLDRAPSHVETAPADPLLLAYSSAEWDGGKHGATHEVGVVFFVPVVRALRRTESQLSVENTRPTASGARTKTVRHRQSTSAGVARNPGGKGSVNHGRRTRLYPAASPQPANSCLGLRLVPRRFVQSIPSTIETSLFHPTCSPVTTALARFSYRPTTGRSEKAIANSIL